MPYFRLLLSFGLIFICFLSVAQQQEPIDSLRSLLLKKTQVSTTSDKSNLAIVSHFLTLAKKVRSTEDVILAYQQLAAINYHLGNTNQALHYYKLYVVELEQLSNNTSNKDQRFRINLYENELKALTAKIESLELESNKLKLQNNELLEKNYWVYLGVRIILIIAALLISGWLYNRYKKPKEKSVVIEASSSSQKITEVLSETKEQLTRAQTELDLADILVQDIITHPDKSFFANKSIRKKILFHQPKNMAGGDGLYIAVEKYKTLIAVFDTPGYGAAGGLLSTRIHNLFEKLVKEHHILAPDLILNQLEINMLNLFPAGVPFTGGINIAVCLYNSTEKLITFAGANMDLFSVHKGLLRKLSGASKSLLDGESPFTYTSSELVVDRGTNIYLSTDGYWIQKGGHDYKPLGESAFEKTIKSLSSQPILEHEQVLIKIFNDWKGSNDQDDDVLVLGLGF